MNTDKVMIICFITGAIFFVAHWITSYINIFLKYPHYTHAVRVIISSWFPYTLFFKQKHRKLHIVSLSFLGISIVLLCMAALLYF